MVDDQSAPAIRVLIQMMRPPALPRLEAIALEPPDPLPRSCVLEVFDQRRTPMVRAALRIVSGSSNRIGSPDSFFTSSQSSNASLILHRASS